MENNKIFA